MVKLENVFTEVQYTFKYEDLGNRYRFILRDNKELAFECAYNGEFYNHIFSIPMELEIGKEYNFIISVNNQGQAIYINDKCIMFVSEKQPIISGKDASIILWNYDKSASIECTLSNFKLIELKK